MAARGGDPRGAARPLLLDVTAYDTDLRQRHNRLRMVLVVIVGLVLVSIMTGLLTVHRL